MWCSLNVTIIYGLFMVILWFTQLRTLQIKVMRGTQHYSELIKVFLIIS